MPEGTVFNPASDVYERYLVPAIFRHWGTELLAGAEPRTGERVLDVACGTGILPRLLADRVGPDGTIVGADINPAMLEVAAELAAGVTPPVRWEQVDASEPLPFDDGAFDLVLCQQGVQFFTDRATALAEMRRVTAPGGRVVVSVWREREHQVGIDRLDAVLERSLPADAVDGVDAPFAFGDADELCRLVRDAGFSDVHRRTVIGGARFGSPAEMLTAVGGAHQPVAEALAALDDAGRARIEAEAAAVLEPYTDDDGVVVPMVASFITARP